MSDLYLLRDEDGDPLGKPSKDTLPILKLISFLDPNQPFIIHEVPENVVRKYFREYRERKKDLQFAQDLKDGKIEIKRDKGK